MPTTVDGLPTHPLLVHAVVVLLPLAALGASRRLRVAAVALTAWTLAIAIPF